MSGDEKQSKGVVSPRATGSDVRERIFMDSPNIPGFYELLITFRPLITLSCKSNYLHYHPPYEYTRCTGGQ